MMNANWSGWVTIAIFIIITAFGFVLWMVFLLLVWFLLQFGGVSANFWAMTEALSTAVAAAAVLGAGFVAYRELSEVASSRHMEVADRLFQELNSPENIAARRWIFQSLPQDPEEGIEALTDEGRAAVKQVLNALDHVAFLTQAGWIPDEIIMPWMHPMIAKSWHKLEPYVVYEARRREEPGYYKNVCQLAARCNAWQAKHLPGWKINWIDDAL